MCGCWEVHRQGTYSGLGRRKKSTLAESTENGRYPDEGVFELASDIFVMGCLAPFLPLGITASLLQLCGFPGKCIHDGLSPASHSHFVLRVG